MNRNIPVPFLGEERTATLISLPDPGKAKDRHKKFLGYQTGDLVKAVTPKGTLQGRVAIRHRPSLRIGPVDVHPKYLSIVQRCDGYSYEKGASYSSLSLKA